MSSEPNDVCSDVMSDAQLTSSRSPRALRRSDVTGARSACVPTSRMRGAHSCVPAKPASVQKHTTTNEHLITYECGVLSSTRLCVCLSVREHISGAAGPIFTKFLCRSLWPWLGPPPAALRYVMYLPVLWMTSRLAVMGATPARESVVDQLRARPGRSLMSMNACGSCVCCGFYHIVHRIVFSF